MRRIRNAFTTLKRRLGERRSRSVPLRNNLKPNRSELKIFCLVDFLGATRGVDGDILECGVGQGFSLSWLLRASEVSGDQRKVLACDSFEGFPPGGPHDSPAFSPSDPKWVGYRLYDQKYVLEYLRAFGIENTSLERVEFVQGFLPESLGKLEGNSFSFVHLDLDLYEPYLECLRWSWDRLSTGGVVTFDEYDRNSDVQKWPGAKSAIDRFCKEHSLALRRHGSGYVYLLKT